MNHTLFTLLVATTLSSAAAWHTPIKEFAPRVMQAAVLTAVPHVANLLHGNPEKFWIGAAVVGFGASVLTCRYFNSQAKNTNSETHQSCAQSQYHADPRVAQHTQSAGFKHYAAQGAASLATSLLMHPSHSNTLKHVCTRSHFSMFVLGMGLMGLRRYHSYQAAPPAKARTEQHGGTWITNFTNLLSMLPGGLNALSSVCLDHQKCVDCHLITDNDASQLRIHFNSCKNLQRPPAHSPTYVPLILGLSSIRSPETFVGGLPLGTFPGSIPAISGQTSFATTNGLTPLQHATIKSIDDKIDEIINIRVTLERIISTKNIDSPVARDAIDNFRVMRERLHGSSCYKSMKADAPHRNASFVNVQSVREQVNLAINFVNEHIGKLKILSAEFASVQEIELIPPLVVGQPFDT